MHERTVPYRKHLITALSEDLYSSENNHHIAPSHLPYQGLDYTYTT